MYVCVDQVVVYLAWCAVRWAEIMYGVCAAVTVVDYIANWTSAADDYPDAVSDIPW